ncbi:MAG TPA: Clp1/GlmU family protein [Thermoanaerobaculia bacterium]|nr:Clp1/GlmU family protein [Thermoanaerobaculia bacterium]HUM30576.1 Clp1/GlmU family protein [Thermoanaerobaculia bacterium]HXK68768.1 Clp1/GlmU family protein [Thermoanaerobaculia bacterium]
MRTIVDEPAWSDPVHRLLETGGTIFLLGGSDAGKTSLARYILDQSIERGLRTAFLDGDIGQSSLGLPGTLSAAWFSTQRELEAFTCGLMTYIGIVSPISDMGFLLHLLETMMNVCRRQSDIVVVDTTGFVSGDMARRFKAREIGVLNPDWIVSVQERDELEPILQEVDPTALIRLQRSSRVKIRNRRFRTNYRARKWRRYFDNVPLQTLEFDSSNVELHYRGTGIEPPLTSFFPGTLVGLNTGDITKAFGILLPNSRSQVRLASPFQTKDRIDRLVLGDLLYPHPTRRSQTRTI